MPSTQRSVNLHSFANSSDTELPRTPIRKRYRDLDFDSPSSVSSLGSPSKRARRDSPKKKDVNLEDALRGCLVKPYDHDAVLALKQLPRDEQAISILVQKIITSAKTTVHRRFQKAKGKLLETELYLEWLKELEYVTQAVEVALNAKNPSTRRRVQSLGRVTYTILYHFLDHFTSEVNSHHDHWSIPVSKSPSKNPPITMTLMEETSDPTTDSRSEKAVAMAEAKIKALDKVMATAVRRYKAECGKNNFSLASKIGMQEHLLTKSCCLLCEQTGFGGDDDDMGDSLMIETRNIMSDWRREYDNDEKDELWAEGASDDEA